MYSKFYEEYYSPEKQIDMDSPEVKFMSAMCAGQGEAAGALFLEETQYEGKSYVDAPHGRFEGVSAIVQYANDWLKLFRADRAEMIPVEQTQAGKRSVTEMVVRFECSGEVNEVPMAVFCDLRPHGLMDSVRIYFFFQWCPDCNAYRKPIYKAANETEADFNLMSDVMRAYFEALHDKCPDRAIARIMDIASDDVRFGGYRPEEVEKFGKGKEQFHEHYMDICYKDVPHNQLIRYETIIDNGKNCVIEWVSIVTPKGREAGCLPISGMASYCRNAEGKICTVRIIDNIGFESLYDLDEK